MARTFFQSASAYISSLTGGDAPEKKEAARIVDEAMDSAEVPKGKDECARVRKAVEAARKGLSLIKTFPIHTYLVALFDDTTTFPTAEEILNLAETNAKRVRNGLAPKPCPWTDEVWTSEAIDCYDAYYRYAQAKHRHGEDEAEPLNVQADNLHERIKKEVIDLSNARLLAAYNAACEWCEVQASAIEADERTQQEMASTVKSQEAARKARNAKRGRLDTMDKVEDQISELRKAMAEQAEQFRADLKAQAEMSNERAGRLEQQLTTAVEALVQFAAVRQPEGSKASN